MYSIVYVLLRNGGHNIMASNLLKTFEKIERGRQKCIAKANEVDFPLPVDASLEKIAQCIDNQGHIDTYIKELKALLTNDYSMLENPDTFRFPADVQNIGSTGASHIHAKDVILPETLNTIGESACQNWYNLEGDLILPEGLTSIGQNAFQRLGQMKGCGTVTVPSTVTSIGISAFAYNGARVFNFNANMTEIPQKICEAYTTSTSATSSNYAFLEEFNIPDEILNNMTNVGASAFRYQKNLKKLPIPPNATTIGSYAYAYCAPTEKVVIPSTFKADLDYYNYAYTNFKGGFEIEDGGPTKLDEYAFDHAVFNQDRLIFPESVYYFPNYCIQYISGNLNVINGSSTYKVIPRVDILHKGTLSVSYGMLSYAKIKTLVIHASNMSYINANGRVFQYTNYIDEMVFPNAPATPPSIGGSTFNNGAPKAIYLPDDYVATYKTASGWSTGASYMKPISQWPGYAEYLEEFGGAE